MRRRRLSYVCALVTLLTVSSASAAAKPGTSWAQAELKTAVAAGLMAKEAAARPNKPLTRAELETLVAGLTHVEPIAPASPTKTVTMAALDARLVGALGLTDTARLFTQAAKNAGLAPPSRFGTEAVARLLGLRTNHPAALDALELSPGEPATHAEAAYSAARILQFGVSTTQDLQELGTTFALPALTQWQKRILNTAVRFIGYPYVWGGESELLTSPFGTQVHGGFDCSGFVWRVYKLEQYPNAPQLADTLQGRTTYAMSREAPAAERIALDYLQPADVIFFGSKGPKSKPAQVDHMGIYLGNGWFIHSSGYGVALASLSGWYAKRFAWARRPLAEAGLSSFS
ncbi:MAG: NlpC/P60 family protein [Actinobacteria bacterium]|nr:MAG: NlpC/P60 family protein [Actinomycetota bacterium]